MSSSDSVRTLSGRRVAVTGAGRGIGRARARKLPRRAGLVPIGGVDGGEGSGHGDRRAAHGTFLDTDRAAHDDRFGEG